MTYMFILKCALKLVLKNILYYDARSKKHQIYVCVCVFVCVCVCVFVCVLLFNLQTNRQASVKSHVNVILFEASSTSKFGI